MPRSSSIDRHVLIYDGDCAFCTLWVNRLREWLPRFPEAKTSQSIVIEDYALTPLDVEKFAWYITPTHHYGGALATSALLRAQPRFALRLLGWLLATPPISWLASGVYALIARYRHKLPGGTPACDPASPTR